MLKFIFNMRNEILSSNSRQPLGRGSNKSISNGSRYESWQYNFNKNTLGSSHESHQYNFNNNTLGSTSCQSCDRIYIDCGNPITYITNPDTSFSACKYKAICNQYNYTYCNDPVPLF